MRKLSKTKSPSSLSRPAAPSFGVIIPAAGSGKRFGQGDKLRQKIGRGKKCPQAQTVLQHAVALFTGRKEVERIIIVTTPDRFAIYRRDLRPLLAAANKTRKTRPVLVQMVEGGRERWESVLFGLRAMPTELGFVAVHDAARPLTPGTVIEAAFTGAVRHGGSVPCLAEPATLKRATAAEKKSDAKRKVGAADLMVTETVNRAGLYQAQTPQCFNREQLLAAYESLLKKGKLAGVTDDAQVFALAGHPVAATLGTANNLKITTAEDLTLAKALLK